MARYEDAIGLEIGDGLVKAIRILSNAKENKLAGFEIQQVNFREGRQGIINAVKAVLEKIMPGKKKLPVNISVSGESVNVRDIHWPQMTEEDIRKALQFEVERSVHFKTGEVVFDYYSVIDKSAGEAKTRVILVATKKDLIENYKGLIADSGNECGFIEVDTFSMLNCFYLSGPKVAEDKTIAIINVGLEVTNIDIIRGKIVGLTKDAFVAWGNLIDAVPPDFDLDFNNIGALKGMWGSDDIHELCVFILNALTNQIRRTIEFYESQGQDSVEEIYLCGRILMHKGLEQYLHSQLGLPISTWDPLSKVSFTKKEAEEKQLKKYAPMLAVCTGLACYRDFKIDLSGKKKKKKGAGKSALAAKLAGYKFPVLCFAFLALFFGSLWTIIASQTKLKEENISGLIRRNQDLVVIVEEVEKLQQAKQALTERMNVVRAVFAGRVVWGEKLNEIVNVLEEDIWLTEMSIKPLEKEIRPARRSSIFERMPVEEEPKSAVNQLVIAGMAFSPEEEQMLGRVNEFLSRLKNSQKFAKDFEKIELVRTTQEKAGAATVMRFEITCVLREETRSGVSAQTPPEPKKK